MGKIIGIDYGLRRIGLAIADSTLQIASPWKVIIGKNDPEMDAKIVFDEILKSGEKIKQVVVGLPKNMDDSEGIQSKLTREFGRALEKISSFPVDYQDERLSSFAAQDKFASLSKNSFRSSRSEKNKKKKPLDAVAAAIILESYLKRKNVSNHISDEV
jgi:putative Holliday junction resolvase